MPVRPPPPHRDTTMSDFTAPNFDSEADTTPLRPGQLSPNGQWIFGSIFAGLVLVGFGFGVRPAGGRPQAEAGSPGSEKGTGKARPAAGPQTDTRARAGRHPARRAARAGRPDAAGRAGTQAEGTGTQTQRERTGTQTQGAGTQA